MVYNRCVGTRTCSNNCPYKVRRFNFVDYQGAEVSASVRGHEPAGDRAGSRRDGKVHLLRPADRRCPRKCACGGSAFGDGEVMTACQQACPTQAIVFGDINDPDSAVSRLKRNAAQLRAAGIAEHQPRTTYLARIEDPKENG